MIHLEGRTVSEFFIFVNRVKKMLKLQLCRELSSERGKDRGNVTYTAPGLVVWDCLSLFLMPSVMSPQIILVSPEPSPAGTMTCLLKILLSLPSQGKQPGQICLTLTSATPRTVQVQPLLCPCLMQSLFREPTGSLRRRCRAPACAEGCFCQPDSSQSQPLF